MRRFPNPWLVSLLALLLLGTARADDAPKAALTEPAAKPAADAEPAARLAPGWKDSLVWRSIGPAGMGGRITAFAVVPSRPTTWWAATASGGLLKTENNGQTFTHQFDHEATVSIGDVAVAPSNPKIVWVGTGESNPRNSVSYGNGVYKSTDGGTTWKHMGLAGSFQTGAVRIHPTNPDIVYVGALGRLWGPNEERGLYKTTDGGVTWTRVLFVDDKTGVIDIAMHPTDPDTLLVATYERQRDEFSSNAPAKRFGPGAALWRTTDAGKTFQRVTKGLPSCNVGRIGLCYAAADPSHVYMVLESEKLGQAPEDSPYLGINGADADVGSRLTNVVKKGPAAAAGLQKNDIVLGLDGKRVHDYEEFIKLAREHVAGDKVKLEVIREKKSLDIELTFGKRPKGSRSPFSAFLNGQGANLQAQQGPQGYEYGGVYKSVDGGVSWSRINSLNPRPMYFSRIRVDPTNEKNIWVLGIRLWRSRDGGKSFKPDGHGREVHVDHHALWIDPQNSQHVLLGNDGGIYVSYDDAKHYDHLNNVAIGQFYHVGVDHREGVYFVYGGLQDNGSWGGPSRVRSGPGPTNHDWFRVGGGDGFRCLVDPDDPDQLYFQSQNGGVGRRHLATGERAGFRPRPARGSKEKYRFNWYAPYQLSHHNGRIYYVAGNYVWRSLDRGKKLKKLSPEITRTKRGSATSFAESPRDADLLYVGTDDGALWASRDGGYTWTDLYLPPGPEVAPKAAPKPAAVDASSGEGHGGEGDGGEGDDGADDAPGKTAAAPKPKPAPLDETSVLPDRAKRLLARLLEMDANGDGRLQKSEMPTRLETLFDAADADHDGAATKSELRLALLQRAHSAAEARAAASDKAAEADKAAFHDGEPAAPTNLPGTPIGELQPARRYVSWIEPSRFKTKRAYVVFDAHRSDDDRALIYVTEDAGRTWRSIVSDLPASAGTTRHLREDPKNANVLWLGTETGAWISLDRGVHWQSLNTNLPTVAVHAFAFHPASGEVVAATHGRSLWILDATPLRQMSAEALSADAFLFKPRRAITWRPLPGRSKAKTFVGENPYMGATIHYRLAKARPSVKLRVTREDGTLVRTLEAKPTPGLHRVAWDLRAEPAKVPAGRRRPRRGRRVSPGAYRVVLEVGEQTLTQPIEVQIDPAFENPDWLAFADQEEAEDAERAFQKWQEKYAPWSGDD